MPDGDDDSKDDAKAGSHYRASDNVQTHNGGLTVKTLVAARQRGPTTAGQIATWASNDQHRQVSYLMSEM